jgi:hypothetical protein
MEDLTKNEGLALKRKGTKTTKSELEGKNKKRSVGFEGDLSESQIQSLPQSSQSFDSGDPFTDEKKWKGKAKAKTETKSVAPVKRKSTQKLLAFNDIRAEQIKGAEIDMAIMKNLQRGVASRLRNQIKIAP